MLIGGEWTAGGGAALPVTDPVDGSLVGEVAFGGKAEALAAADAASSAFGGWAATPPGERAETLHLVAAVLLERVAEIAPLLSRETGKRIAEAEAEVRFASEYFTWFAGEATRPDGDASWDTRAQHRRVMRRPAGVAVCLTPWNFPVSIPARKLAAALAAGCTVVLRPSEKAPLSTVALFDVLDRAGLPPGVVNIVHGEPAEQAGALLSHRSVRVLSFTGSTAVGRRLLTQAAERVVKPVMELGGDAPFIVFDDADLDAAVSGLLVAKLRNNGQSCIAANRVLVARPMMELFLARISAAVAAVVAGDPRARDTALGPLIDETAAAGVAALVGDAVASGAQVATPEIAVPPRSTFHPPMFLRDVAVDSRLWREEVFGPVAGVAPFDSEEQAIEMANDTDLGLAAYIYTRDIARAQRCVTALDVGLVGVNTGMPAAVSVPMGGAKQSGLGREGGHRGMDEFLELRSVTLG